MDNLIIEKDAFIASDINGKVTVYGSEPLKRYLTEYYPADEDYIQVADYSEQGVKAPIHFFDGLKKCKITIEVFES